MSVPGGRGSAQNGCIKPCEAVENASETRRSVLLCACVGVWFFCLSTRPISSTQRSSGGAWFCRPALIEKWHQPFKILGGSRQQKLLGDVPYPSQSHPT